MSTEFVQKYSYALFEVSQEINDQNIISELKLIKENLKDLELQQFLSHPQIDKNIKKETLKKIFGEFISEYLQNFLYVLVDNNRIFYFKDIFKSFEDIWYEMQNIERVKVISAVKLSEEKLLEISQAYKGNDLGEIEISNEVDPSIIGGLILKVDNRIIDRSLKGQLQEMEKKLHQIT